MTPVDVLDVVEVEQILESVEVLVPVDGEGGAGAGERGLHQDVLHPAVHLEADGVVEVVGGGPHQVAPLLRVSEQEDEHNLCGREEQGSVSTSALSPPPCAPSPGSCG